ncbi:MAG: ASKHA domain-containing protein, partial [Candidatus Thorarchaeota archaeon]
MTTSESLGISVDIGTTNVTLHLIDIESFQILRELTIHNPQREFGEEIISRIDYARNRENALKFTSSIRQAISYAIRSMLDDTHHDARSVVSVVIVGNTAMHHFFFDLPTDSLLKPPYAAEHKDAILISASDVDLPFDTKTICYSPSIIESYVGTDAVAMMIASGFPESKNTLVSIDVGTNTEIAILTDGRMWVTSAASGPAFEGMSIQCGMPGDSGAIHSVKIRESDLRPLYEVIGGGRPSGICGTGVVSAIASMLDTGILLPRGSFNRSISSPRIVLDSPIVHYIIATAEESSTDSSIVLTQPDVRMLQQSKAAIRGAFELLLKHAKMTPEDIHQLNLTGVFGSGLSYDATVRIGLLPVLPSADIQQISGGAIQGADLLHKEEYRQIAARIVSE